MIENRITHVVSGLRPGGGPGGYLYNLEEHINQNLELSRLITVLPLKESHYTSKQRGTLRKTLRAIKYKLLTCLPNRKYTCDLQKWQGCGLNVPEYKLKIILSSKVIVAHNLYFAIYYSKHLRLPFKQRFYIFNHSPVDCARETVEKWTAKYGRNLPDVNALLDRLSEIEIDTYGSADGFIVACRESLDSYFEYNENKRRRFEELLGRKEIYEVPTGVPEVIKADSSCVSFDRSRIPNNRVVVGYFGRYHKDKGFDLFCDAVNRAKTDSRFFFVSAGRGNIKPFSNCPNYINLGFLNKSTELPYFMDLCDIILIPNRHTYFDLAVLEAMSLGKPVVASNTGGNKYLGKRVPGIILCDISNAASILDVLSKLTRADIENKGAQNRLAYEKEFSMSKFLERHLSLAVKLLGINQVVEVG
jgi:glycosyltransferase involved in cell wall biosynthesis